MDSPPQQIVGTLYLSKSPGAFSWGELLLTSQRYLYVVGVC